MGLVGVVLSAHNVYDNLTYDGNSFNSTNNTWTPSLYGTYTQWNGSTTFTSSDKPLVSGTTCYQVVKPASTTLSYSASTDATNNKYSWSQACTVVATANTYESYTVDYDVDFIAATWVFSYSGTGQQWVAPKAGTYKMECWGANGGPSPYSGSSYAVPGIGGYTAGDLALSSNHNLYVYVGEVGKNNVKTLGSYNVGGWNGGGISSKNAGGTEGYEPGSGGGGSTDIRCIQHSSGTWGYNSSTVTVDASVKTRIMVAGGGGGCGYVLHHNYNSEIGGCGGGLIGEPGTAYGATPSTISDNYNTSTSVSPGGTQTESPEPSSWNWDYRRGAFGRASQQLLDTDSYGCGAGGGWYGGVKGIGNGGGGGSSFISGHPGCNAINTSTGVHLGQSTKITYSGITYEFHNTVMIDGDGYSWTSASQTRVYSSATVPGLPKIGSTTASKPGVPSKPTQTNNNNGYCRITYIPD